MEFLPTFLFKLMILLLLEVIQVLFHGLLVPSLIVSLSRTWGIFIFFLDVEVLSTPTGLFLSQQKYIRDLLNRTNMAGAKEVSTPLSTSGSLTLHDGSSSTDATDYRSVIGPFNILLLHVWTLPLQSINCLNLCTNHPKFIGQRPKDYFGI